MIEIVNNTKPIEIVTPTAQTTQQAYNKGYIAGEKYGYLKGLEEALENVPQAEGVAF